MKKLLTFFFNWILAMNPIITVGTGLLGSLYVAWVWVGGEWVYLFSVVDSIVQLNYGGTLNVAPLGLLDTIIPLHETLTYFVAWLGVFSICTIVRIVKSFIPTIAS